ncbi:hypothetical protein AB4072_11655 [Microvirga sp. 2MCAF38]|uniref:hypothetical protein n=1 Tax=Microvirga sp. 2MCAF38 TaxID=3232989 RepID=UPI003F9C0EAC
MEPVEHPRGFDIFDPEGIQILDAAFKKALNTLTDAASDHAIPAMQVRRLLAQLIIERANVGERDPDLLSQSALKALMELKPVQNQ